MHPALGRDRRGLEEEVHQHGLAAPDRPVDVDALRRLRRRARSGARGRAGPEARPSCRRRRRPPERHAGPWSARAQTSWSGVAAQRLRRDLRAPRRQRPCGGLGHGPSRQAKARSISRRKATVGSFGSISTSSQVTGRPKGMALRSRTPWARPMGRPPSASEVRRRHELAPDAIAALPVQHFAGPEIAFRGGDDIAGPALRMAGRLAAQRRRRHRHAEFQPDQVRGPPERRIFAALVRGDVVFGEAALHILVRPREGDIDPLAQVVRHLLAVRAEAGDHLHIAAAPLQRAAVGLGFQQGRRARKRKRGGRTGPCAAH